MIKIKTLEELRGLTRDRQLDCFITLGGGILRSSKNIYFYSNICKYEVMHEIDGTVELLTEKQLLEETNIGKALQVGALFSY